MSRNDTTSKIIDSVLKLTITGAAVSAGLLIPNALIGLEKPLNQFLDHLDKREREREARRIISYMKSQGFLAGEYRHGLTITPKGQRRLAALDFESLQVPILTKWDHMWRIIFYDVPETSKAERRMLTAKLRELGFFQLQQSVWIHPFPCREVIEKVTSNYSLERYVSYVETAHLDNQSELITYFRKRLPAVSFK